jgi:DNA-directed RNA polymerase subunit F
MTTTLRFEKSPTLRQQKMAINVLTAMGMPAYIEKFNYCEPAKWVPTKEELERIDRAKKNASEGKIIRLNPEFRKELFG